MDRRQSRRYYNLDEIKCLSIIDVCRSLGIEITVRGGKHWCKIRSERTPSTVLDLERNLFYDFGVSSGGDVIKLVSVVRGTTAKEAIEYLAQIFGIDPVESREGRDNTDLSDWEWRKIGMYGDLAVKNFSFDPSRQSLSRIQELSNRYSMSMTELRTKHPYIYERLLAQCAIPYVENLRNDYYLEVLSKYMLYHDLGDELILGSSDTRKWFEDHYLKDLRISESTLRKACEGTGLKVPVSISYVPEKDIKRIQEGRVDLRIKPVSKEDMQRMAVFQGTTVLFGDVDFRGYLNCNLDDYIHSAYLKDGRVVVGYLESDYSQIKPLLDEISDIKLLWKQDSKSSLVNQIENAGQSTLTIDSKDELVSERGVCR